MKPRKIRENVYWAGAIDWDRRLFDALIPLPDGTSYNAYFVDGGDKTALIDTVDPPMTGVLMEQLKSLPPVDYIVCNHVEQDHSGAIPDVLSIYPKAEVLCSKKAKELIIEHLHVDEGKIRVVEDGEKVKLGRFTLEFIYTPWVHWPETMVTYVPENKTLFSCDFFGSHMATSDLYVTEWERYYEPAKRYYAEIMMPFAGIIGNNLKKLEPYEIEMICPSHGPTYPEPRIIMDAYREWALGEPKNIVVIPYVSMHGSTGAMVKHLTSALVERGVGVEVFDISATDLGKIAMALVDAATVVIGAPTILAGPHPLTVFAAFVAAALRPKARFVSIIGSYGWGGRTVEVLSDIVGKLKPEVIQPVLAKGKPRPEDFEALDELADSILKKHKDNGYT
jgi:flavorubredoxin